jgi:hypothetical protein
MKSKFSIAQTILIPGYLFLATFGLAGLLMFAGVSSLRKSDNDGFLLLGSGLVFLAMSFLVVSHYLRLLNKIEISLEGITIKGVFKNKMITWDEVESINLSGKEPETFMFMSMPMEAVSILTNVGLKEVLLVKLYSNMHRMRTALHLINFKLAKQEKITSECFIPVQRAEPKVIDLSRLEKFGGYHLVTLNGLFVYGIIFFSVWLFVFTNSPIPLLEQAVVLMILLFFGPGLFGYQLHYFKLNQEYLVVKNHIWLWRNDVYLVKDLREIVFEEPHKMSTSLRVITNNYEHKLYPAGSLRDKSWRKLKEQITALGIKVRDEAYFDL